MDEMQLVEYLFTAYVVFIYEAELSRQKPERWPGD